MKSYRKYLLILLFSSSLVACGGGGGGDTTPSAAKISAVNEKDLGKAAAEGAKQALNGGNAPVFFRRSASRNTLETLNESVANQLASRVALQIVDLSTQICTEGGSALIDTNPDGTSSVITYSSCSTGSGIINGVANINVSTAGSITTLNFSYVDFTITIGSETTTIDLVVSCTSDSSTGSFSCTYSSDVVGLDGRTYTVSGSTIAGDSSSGYTVSATITDPEHGTISITTTTPILFNCSNGQPGSGEIQFSDGDGVLVTVTFNDCDSFTISYSGTSTMYLW